MLFTTREQSKSVLEEMAYLPIDEGVNSEIDRLSTFKVYERPSSDQYVVNIEEGMQFCKDNDMQFTDLITRVSELNRICESDIVFSIHPATALIDEGASELCASLLKEGREVYNIKSSNPWAIEFGNALVEAVENDCAYVIDELINEGVLDKVTSTWQAIKDGTKSGSVQFAKDTALGAAQVGANAIGNAIGAGVQKTGQGVVQRKLDNFAPTQKIQDIAKAHGVSDEGLRMIGDFANGVKGDLSKTISQIGLNGAGATIDKLKEIAGQVTEKLGFFTRQLASGNIDQNKRSFLQKGIDTLTRLKDLILNKIKGIKK